MTFQVQPFLMFQGECEAALTRYVALFPDARIEDLRRWGADGPGGAAAEGKVLSARLTVAGQTVLCNDSPIKHGFAFTPSFSFFVTCEDEAQQDRLAAGLAEGGEYLMGMDDYGFSRRFCWLNDAFGVSWQLNLP
jgi:predicted 3-demethylubiquinone-9 3-methyltransferase (glyoxalase superfamily)